MASVRGTLFVVGMVAVCLGGATLPLFLRWCDQAKLGSVPGKPGGALLVSAADGPALLLFDEIRHGDAYGARVVSIDPATGRETGRHVVKGTSNGPCRQAAPGRLWCSWKYASPEPWALVDARTLRVVADVAATVKAAGFAHLAPREVELRTEGAYVTLDDGRIARVDASTLAVTTVLVVPSTDRPSGPGQSCDRASSLDVGEVHLELQGDPRTRVVIGRDMVEQEGAAGADFLKPAFLRVPLAGGALVVHETSLDPARSTAQLSRVDLAGQIVWTVPIGAGCEEAALVGDALIVTTSSPRPRAMALDPATGQERWRIDR